MNIYLNLLLFLLTIQAHSQISAYPALSNQIILHGRYYVRNDSVFYDWTCFKIDFCFKDTKQVTWNVVDTWNIYDIVVDGSTTKTVQPKKNQKIIIFQADAPQSHCIEIIKITENHYGPLSSKQDSIFKGIQIVAGELVRNSKQYNYRFDFLGDSITTAYGVMSGRNPVCFLRMKQIQNCRQSWAVHLSNLFNAAYRLQAVSGKGVVRNMIGVPGVKMPALFTRLTDNSQDNSYKLQDGYVPDALFVFIGENDYSNIKNPSISNFVNGYVQMLERIVRDYLIYADRAPKIINVCDIEFNKELCYNVKTAVKNFSFEFKRVYYLEVPQGTIGRQHFGCIWHPNAEGQTRIANVLYPAVKQILAI